MGHHANDFQLNSITIRRKNLTYEEAVEVWRLHLSGDLQHIIAAKFGTNGGRVADILTEKKHVGAKAEALR